MTASLKTPLWPHQRKAVDFALGGTPQAGRAGWWYDMRTGKTLSALALMTETKANRVLVVAPPVPAKEWARQAPLHLDGDYPVPVLLNKGSVRARVALMRDAWLEHKGRIMAVWNYEAVIAAPELLKVDWDLLIYDEAHRVKGPTSKISKYAREKLRSRATRIVALSGTPLPQGNHDAYGVYTAFADVFPVKNWTHFRNRYAVRANPHIPQQITGWRDEHELQACMARWAISCRMEDVLPGFKAPQDEWQWVELSPATAQAYESLDADMIAQVDRGEIVASNALVKALRLQQLAGGCAAIDDGPAHCVSNEKHEALAGLLEDVPATEPVVVFAQFVSELDRCCQVAERLGRPLFYVRGGIDQEREFHESAARGEGPMIALQIQAGSEGIDLSESRVCFFLSTGYSSFRYQQARARLLGSRQKHHVTYWHIGAAGTIDAEIASAQERKIDFEDAILEKLNVRHLHVQG